MQYVITPKTKGMEQIVWWEGAFTEQELDWLQKQAKNAKENSIVGLAGGGEGINLNVRRSQTSWLNNTPNTKWVFERLAIVAANLNSQFFRFDLSGFGEPLQLTNYNQSENGMYGWHQDFGGEGVSRKLSLVLQLTDPAEYEGGNFEIMISETPQKIRKQRGLVLAFPSFVLHQVTPVTQGSRQSLVAWVSGPEFK